MRVLLIEDDRQLGRAIHQGLKQEYASDWFRTAEEGADALAVTRYDVIVLDINLPGMSGLDWLARLRRNQDAVPVLLLTARDTTQERVQGLDAGADDYLVKPFDFEELLARIRALARRREHFRPKEMIFGDLVLDIPNKSASFANKPLSLSQKEFEILRLLADHAGHFVSKEKIEQNLYGWDDSVGSNTVEVHISALRRKLGKNFIRTARNLGYKIEVAA